MVIYDFVLSMKISNIKLRKYRKEISALQILN